MDETKEKKELSKKELSFLWTVLGMVATDPVFNVYDKFRMSYDEKDPLVAALNNANKELGGMIYPLRTKLKKIMDGLQ